MGAVQCSGNDITGTTAQATEAWPGPDDLYKWNWNQLSKYVVTSLDSFAQGIGHEALQKYNASHHNGRIDVFGIQVNNFKPFLNKIFHQARRAPLVGSWRKTTDPIVC
ncbi:uncharacterized protein TNCV_3452291 [Trichonephila clavipes]|nr:uncharacterized protein TNCV_3452291 [Trichonephila clavipes]